MDGNANVPKVDDGERQPNDPGPVSLEQLGPEVRLLVGTDVDHVWDKVKEQRSTFFEPGPQDEVLFKQLLMAPPTVGFLIMDGAVVYFTEVQEHFHAFFNGVVWDKKLYRRQDIAKRILKLMFYIFGLQKVTASIPSDNVLAAQFAESLGFTPEGRVTRIIRRGNEMLDVLYYGLKREEVMGHGTERVGIGPLGSGRGSGSGVSGGPVRDGDRGGRGTRGIAPDGREVTQESDRGDGDVAIQGGSERLAESAPTREGVGGRGDDRPLGASGWRPWRSLKRAIGNWAAK